jgi:predicted dehydrogenase
VIDIGEQVQPGKLLMVGHIFVHHPQMLKIKSMLSNGAIGDLVHITSRRLNWGIYQTKTDPLLSLATHDISIILELLGGNLDIKQAQAWNYSNNSQHDRVWFSGSSNTEVTFDCDVSWHWPVRTRQTIIIGTRGQIVWDQDTNSITITNNKIEDRRAVLDNIPEVIAYSYDVTPLEAELKHWVDCVNNRQEPKTGLQDAKAVANIIDCIKKLI